MLIHQSVELFILSLSSLIIILSFSLIPTDVDDDDDGMNEQKRRRRRKNENEIKKITSCRDCSWELVKKKSIFVIILLQWHGIGIVHKAQSEKTLKTRKVQSRERGMRTKRLLKKKVLN